VEVVPETDTEPVVEAVGIVVAVVAVVEQQVLVLVQIALQLLGKSSQASHVISGILNQRVAALAFGRRRQT
jgi:hypothetical protein